MTVIRPAERVEAMDVAAQEEPRLRIGEMAKQTGLTARTLRYWEEIGLLKPCAHRGSGERLYSLAERERVTHIRELQDLLGLTLAEIHDVLASEDTLERARRAARADAPTPKRLRLLADAIDANGRLVERINERLARITEFRDECVDRGERMRARRVELQAEERRASR
ncbi:MAG TPA: MerR family transcriptional regulator [Acidimicrobiales bacterium]|nr:MerR family transcriptional regulator [Acidimicrobiales bacterium]